MRIMQVEKTLVSTNRIKEMGHRPLLVVIDKSGGTPAVAVDAVGCIPGDWVICVGSSAAREAADSAGALLVTATAEVSVGNAAEDEGTVVECRDTDGFIVRAAAECPTPNLLSCLRGELKKHQIPVVFRVARIGRCIKENRVAVRGDRPKSS